MSDSVRLTFRDDVAHILLDRPDVFNALSSDMIDALIGALEQAGDKARALVLSGAGKAFCAGANLSRFKGLAPGAPVESNMETHYHPLMRRLRDFPVPVVTAVHGAAAGGGMALAISGDLCVAERSSYFLQAFRRIGLVPDCGSSWILPRLVGRARAVELSLLGEKLPAEKALEWGLIHRVVADGKALETALALAGELARGPTRALGATRAMYRDAPQVDYESQLDREYREQRAALSSADHLEGARAFIEKRPAKFSGR